MRAGNIPGRQRQAASHPDWAHLGAYLPQSLSHSPWTDPPVPLLWDLADVRRDGVLLSWEKVATTPFHQLPEDWEPRGLGSRKEPELDTTPSVYHDRVRLMCRETEFFCCLEGKVATTPLSEMLKGWQPRGLHSRRSQSSITFRPIPLAFFTLKESVSEQQSCGLKCGTTPS